MTILSHSPPARGRASPRGPLPPEGTRPCCPRRNKSPAASGADRADPARAPRQCVPGRRLDRTAVGHVKVRFRQRIALIEIDGAFARHRVVGRLDVRVRVAEPVGRCLESGTRCSPTPRRRTNRRPCAGRRASQTDPEVGNVGCLQPVQIGNAPSRRRHAAKPNRTISAMMPAAGTHQLVVIQSIQDPDSAGAVAGFFGAAATGAGWGRSGSALGRRRTAVVEVGGTAGAVAATPSLRCNALSSLLRISIRRWDSASCLQDP